MSADDTTPADLIQAQLEARPVRLVLPPTQRLPVIFSSPHSGRVYAPRFLAQSRLNPISLRHSEDAFVDELFEAATGFGCPILAAEFPRAYVDANRSKGEIDTILFDAPVGLAVDAPSPRVQAGLGVIPRVVRDGVEIYADKLPASEAARRLDTYYKPYHAALAALVAQTYKRFGCALVVDCHSMPSVPVAPEIVFGDCHSTSLDVGFMRHAERAFLASGFATARNSPYAGGYTTRLYARRDEGIHALQIEINRALYLDEAKVAKAPSFAGIKGRLTAALRHMLSFDFTALRPRRALAAE